jgi:hypothetical protein
MFRDPYPTLSSSQRSNIFGSGYYSSGSGLSSPQVPSIHPAFDSPASPFLFNGTVQVSEHSEPNQGHREVLHGLKVLQEQMHAVGRSKYLDRGGRDRSSQYYANALQLRNQFQNAFQTPSSLPPSPREREESDMFTDNWRIATATRSGGPSTQPPAAISQVHTLSAHSTWTLDSTRINPGPFAWADVFGEINPHFLAGKQRETLAHPAVRTMYSTEPYGVLDMVRPEQGGKWGIELFRRTRDVHVKLECDARGRLAAFVAYIMVSSHSRTLLLSIHLFDC